MATHKVLKATALLIALGYCSLLVYQGGVPFNFQENRAGTEQVTELIVAAVRTTTDDSVIKNLTLDDIFISVKTSRHYQDTRLPLILKTWFKLAKRQTWFFTDTENPQHQRITHGHMVNTNCSDTHQRKHLCCKTSVEYDYYLKSGKKWFCHFDDDNYVNVPRLVTVLQKYNHRQDWYLGRTSITNPLKIYVKADKHQKKSTYFSFWFATGGAGFCISKSLAFKMSPIASGGKFISVCEGIRLPDDVTMGFIIEHMTKNRLTLVPEFHSHLEQLKLLPLETLRDQISFGYSGPTEMNVVNVPGFDTKFDPSRFLSLHCFLFPHYRFCPR